MSIKQNESQILYYQEMLKEQIVPHQSTAADVSFDWSHHENFIHRLQS